MSAANRISRRVILAGLLGGIAVAAGASQWRWFKRAAAADLAAFVRRRLAYLPLADDAADRFAADYTRRFGAGVMNRYHALTFGGWLSHATLARISESLARDAIRLERRLVGDFLRSSTYFRERPGSPVRFVAYPDPYEGACTNPFADLSMS